MIEKGALFCWYFHYMPVGASSPASLKTTPEQRERMYHFVRDMRSKKELFTMDFQNDGEFVGGCIAGGRRYLHINAAGDVEPCVFIHYSNVNIHDVTLLEALKSPLFMKYYENKPFNDNHCGLPMLENPTSSGSSPNPVRNRPGGAETEDLRQDRCRRGGAGARGREDLERRERSHIHRVWGHAAGYGRNRPREI
ncbi:MAG: hypothetical protein ACLTKG_02955 [Collinsella intestinalis]